MEKKPIINFEGMQFRLDRRARLPRGKSWQVRRYRRSRSRLPGNVRSVFSYLFGR